MVLFQIGSPLAARPESLTELARYQAKLLLQRWSAQPILQIVHFDSPTLRPVCPEACENKPLAGKASAVRGESREQVGVVLRLFPRTSLLGNPMETRHI
jgi:hypothetical protein